MKTILIARTLKGKDVILAGSNVEFAEQLKAYNKFQTLTSDEYTDVQLVELVDVKKPLKLKLPK